VGLTEKTESSASSDGWIMPILGKGFLGGMILPAADYRYNWTIDHHIFWEIVGLVLMNIGIIIMDVTMIQNAYASKLLDINKNQKLIDTGLYACIRHPLYSGAFLMILGLPIALGSWYSLFPALVGILNLVIRINFEEDMLINGMERYAEYRMRVKYKLIPGIY
jgi:protein-S-isoprenylcysteine O-methyltransferase Ste14